MPADVSQTGNDSGTDETHIDTPTRRGNCVEDRDLKGGKCWTWGIERELYDQLTEQMIRQRGLDDLLLSTQMRYTKKNWTINETMEAMIGTSKAESWGEVRRSMLPKPRTNQW